MFLKSVRTLDVAYADACSALVNEPGAWLHDLVGETELRGGRLLVEVGLMVAGRPVRRRARLQVGDALVAPRVASLPLRLVVDEHQRLFPIFHGSLDLAWLGPERIHLALSVQYDAPVGRLGRTVDRALLHRAAEAMAEDLLASIARHLMDGVPAVSQRRSDP